MWLMGRSTSFEESIFFANQANITAFIPPFVYFAMVLFTGHSVVEKIKLTANMDTNSNKKSPKAQIFKKICDLPTKKYLNENRHSKVLHEGILKNSSTKIKLNVKYGFLGYQKTA